MTHDTTPPGTAVPDPYAVPAPLDLRADVVDLTAAVCDVASVSGDETRLADAVEAALRGLDHLEVLRDGDAVVARTNLGLPRRVVVAGHLDTVPVADRPGQPGVANVPTWRTGEGDDEILWGRGTVDMKGGVGVALALAARVGGDLPAAADVTWVFYDHEEVAANLNGLGRLVREHPGTFRPSGLAAALAGELEPPAVAEVVAYLLETGRIALDDEGYLVWKG